MTNLANLLENSPIIKVNPRKCQAGKRFSSNPPGGDSLRSEYVRSESLGPRSSRYAIAAATASGRSDLTIGMIAVGRARSPGPEIAISAKQAAAR